MRKMKHWLITATVLLCSLTTSAQKFEVDEIYYNITSITDLTVDVTFKGSSYGEYFGEYSGEVDIPSTVTYSNKTYRVTGIGERAFSDCSLTAITIPEGVTSIGSHAFSGCYSLTSITVPEGVKTIGSHAFTSCTRLTTITIPEGVTSIGSYAFYYCRSLTSITLPEGVKTIGSDAFSGCSSLTDITLPEGVTSIGDCAFRDCTNLTSITIPESVTSIGYATFSGCYCLTSITIPGGVTSIGGSAFSQCRSLATITIPEGVTSIEHSAFSDCYSLTSIVIPRGVTSIGDYAFFGSNLTSITIPENSQLKSIGYNAFASCWSLTAITIPEGVTSIGESTFSDCTNLTSITIPENSQLESIGDYAFFGCSLSSITIPEDVTSIGGGTFSDCYSLTSITIPESVTGIGYNAFASCTSLTSITIPENSQLKSIGDNAFSGCTSLTSITLPESVAGIGWGAFANCPELLDVYCNAETVPTAETDAFNGSYPDYATLHVPASAFENYRTMAPWSSFGTIVSLTNELVTGIALSQTTVTMVEGTTLTLTATIVPTYVTDPTVTWSSSDEDVATVADGKVTAIAPGTATITATANDGSGVSASCTVTVEESVNVTITMNQYGSATYCSEYALDFSEVKGLKAYAATGYNTSTGVVTLTRVMTAKAGMGLFLKGEPGEYTVPTMEDSDDNSLNMLVGALEKTALDKTSADGLYRNYRYTTKTGVPTPMFYEIPDGYTLSANRAYLQIPLAWLPTETKSISLRFDDGGATDMEVIESEVQDTESIYDLMGCKVINPRKGLVYIVNGKKIVY